MHKTLFSRLELTWLMQSHGRCSVPSLGPQRRRLQPKGWELLGARAVCGFSMSIPQFVSIARDEAPLSSSLTPVLQWVAPLVLFRCEDGAWSAQCVLGCHPSTQYDPALDESIFTLLDRCYVEYVPLTHELIDCGYLDCPEFRRRLRRAFDAPTRVPPKPLPSLQRVRQMLERESPTASRHQDACPSGSPNGLVGA